MAANSETLPLPPDLMIKIFQLLPSKSIPTLELVSKQWMNLIKSPKYFDLYPHRSTFFFLGTKTLCCLLVNQSQKLTNGRNPPFKVHQIPTDLASFGGHNFSGLQLLNSAPINGLICIKSANGAFLVYNLFAEASFAIEGAPIQRNPSSWISYGFGYDPHGDDYKIFVAEKGLFWVYSFVRHDWERFEGFPDYNWLFPLGFCFNGVLHWLASNTTTTNWESGGSGSWLNAENTIVSYDLRTRRFGEMALPKEGYRGSSSSGMNGSSSVLAELNGRLCICCCIRDEGFRYGKPLETACSVHVWVMKEYGVEESWEEWASVSCYPCVANVPWSWKRPSVLLEEGEDGRQRVAVVCSYDAMQFWYEVEGKKKEEVDENGMELPWIQYGRGGYAGRRRLSRREEEAKKKMKVIVFWYNGMENKMGVLEEKD